MEFFWTLYTNTLIPLLSGPEVPLILAAAFVLFVVGVGASVVWHARARARMEVAGLLRELSVTRAKLIEAEKTGKFGTFSWDFHDASTSFWSDEMFFLFGFVPRKKPPAIDSIMQHVHERDREQAMRAWEKACREPGEFALSFRTVSPRGQVRSIDMRGKTMLGVDHTPKTIQGVAHDVTREMEIDRAKSEFVSLASHQLKTPLTSIKWLSEALLSSKTDALSSTAVKYLNDIHDATRRMVEMVNDLLNVSRIELERIAVRPEEIDACELARSVAEEQRHAFESKGVKINLLCGRGIPRIYADKALFRMVVQNLLSNAVKYTPEGGSVECELSLSGGRREMLFIRVSDTGIGIPKEERDNVFKKLFRASNAQTIVPDGTGLGLYVVKTVVEYVQGGISFESTEGKGTTFYVSLPLQWVSTSSDAR